MRPYYVVGMKMTDLERFSGNHAVLLSKSGSKDFTHRLRKYVAWIDATGFGWAAPDLHAYRDYLLHDEQLTPESVAVHLSTVRSRYRELLLDRKMFFSLVPPQSSFAEHKALVDELMARIEAAIDPRSAPLTTRSRQDRPDSENLRLSKDQARELLAQPRANPGPLASVRDRAIISMLLCTGIREAELCALQVQDLRQTLEGEPALHVRLGKGSKERLIPYGSLKWCLNDTVSWLRAANIVDRYVFRGLRKGDHVRETALNERTIQKILARYPIEIYGQLVTVRPHDCRRTYARWLYEAGVKIDAIRQNMGHESTEMTFHYIGQPGIADRLPPEVFTP
jgi:integrase